MYELVYTSAKEGMIPMRSGFTSVAWTEGFPANLVQMLENMSSYKVLYSPGSGSESKNPDAYSYRKLLFGAGVYRIVSRISFAGLDYTNRTNKIAHHLVFASGAGELASAGGALAVAMADGNFRRVWNEDAHTLPVKRFPMSNPSPFRYASPTWKKYTGDSGFAGVAAELFMRVPKNPVYLVFEAGTPASDLLAMFAETAALLPAAALDDFTFSTYFDGQTSNAECFMRAVTPDSENLAAARRFRPENVIDFASGTPEMPLSMLNSSFVESARGIGKSALSECVHGVSGVAEYEDSPLTAVKRMEPAGSGASVVPPPEKRAEEDQAWIRRRLPGIVLAGAALIAACAAVCLIFIFSSKGCIEPPVENSTPPVTHYPQDREEVFVIDEPLPEVSVPETQLPEAEKPGVIEVALPEPAASDVGKNLPDENVKVVEKHISDLSPDEAFAMLKFWRGGAKEKFKLPESVKNAERLEAGLSGVGDLRHDVFIASGGQRGFTFVNGDGSVSVKSASFDGKPSDEAFRISIADGMLAVVFSSECGGTSIPSLADVASITFVLGGEHIKWDNRFSDPFLPLMLKGELMLDGSCNIIYIESADEKLFGDDIAITLNGVKLDRNAFSGAFLRRKTALKKACEAENDYASWSRKRTDLIKSGLTDVELSDIFLYRLHPTLKRHVLKKMKINSKKPPLR